MFTLELVAFAADLFDEAVDRVEIAGRASHHLDTGHTVLDVVVAIDDLFSDVTRAPRDGHDGVFIEDPPRRVPARRTHRRDRRPADRPGCRLLEQAITDTLDKERRDACALLDHASGPWTYYSRPGPPARLLAGLADTHDAEMIIIGASRGGLVAWLHRLTGESVSSQLFHHAQRPVLLVPEPLETR